MINIRPISDLRNKYNEIEDAVLKEEEAVYLTKNGYGSMVVMSLEKYEKLMNKVDLETVISEKFGNIDIEKALDEAESELDDPNTKYLTHEEVFSNARRILNGEKWLWYKVSSLKRSINPASFEIYNSVKKRNYDWYRIYVKNFTILYTVRNNTMEVVHIFYSKRNIEELI